MAAELEQVILLTNEPVLAFADATHSGGAGMITGELNHVTLVPTSRPVRSMMHKLVIRTSFAGGYPHACPQGSDGVLRPDMIRNGAREHPTEISPTAAKAEPHHLPIDDPTLVREPQL